MQPLTPVELSEQTGFPSRLFWDLSASDSGDEDGPQQREGGCPLPALFQEAGNLRSPGAGWAGGAWQPALKHHHPRR